MLTKNDVEIVAKYFWISIPDYDLFSITQLVD